MEPSCCAGEQWAQALPSTQIISPISGSQQPGTWTQALPTAQITNLGITPPIGSSPQPIGLVPDIIITDDIFWVPGQTLRIGFKNGTTFQKQEVKSYADEWCKYANLTFSFVNSEPYDIYIDFTPGESWSHLGTRSRKFAGASPPLPSMRLGWVDKTKVPVERYRATILHEFGHALGLTHEHQNPFRSTQDNLEWDVAAVYAYFAKAPNSWKPEKTNTNVLSNCTGKVLRKNFFDLDSIMLYTFPKELFKGGAGTSKNFDLSVIDKGCMLQRYPGRDLFSQEIWEEIGYRVELVPVLDKGPVVLGKTIYPPQDPDAKPYDYEADSEYRDAYDLAKRRTR